MFFNKKPFDEKLYVGYLGLLDLCLTAWKKGSKSGAKERIRVFW